MALPKIKNMVGMTVTSVAGSGLGLITLNAAYSDANDVYRSMATAFGADAVTNIRIEEGTAWQIGRSAQYTHSGTTITQGTFVASSTGSPIAFTSAAVVFVVNDASLITRMQSIATSISGLLCGYNASTTASIGAGSCWIEDVQYTQGSGTTLSLVSGNEIGASSLATDKLLFIYAYNNAGTLAYKWDLRSTSGDDPVWDEDYQYWKHPTNGASYRLIGVLRTLDTGSTIGPVSVIDLGGRRRAMMNSLFHQILTVTGTTSASLALAGYVPKNGDTLVCLAGSGDTTAAGMAQGNLSLKSTVTGSGTDAQIVAKGYVSAANNTALFGQNRLACDAGSTIYAVAATATNYARIYYVGTEYMV